MKKHSFSIITIFLIAVICCSSCENKKESRVIKEYKMSEAEELGIVASQKITFDAEEESVVIDNIEEKLTVIDSNAVIFDMAVNGKMWHKNDSSAAEFSSDKNVHIFRIMAYHSSVAAEDIVFTAVLARNTIPLNDYIAGIKTDTVMASVYYSFSEFDFERGIGAMKYYLGISLPTSPTAALILSEVDTAKKTINGTFFGYVTNNEGVKQRFTNGIFRNIPYQIKETGLSIKKNKIP